MQRAARLLHQLALSVVHVLALQLHVFPSRSCCLILISTPLSVDSVLMSWHHFSNSLVSLVTFLFFFDEPAPELDLFIDFSWIYLPASFSSLSLAIVLVFSWRCSSLYSCFYKIRSSKSCSVSVSFSTIPEEASSLEFALFLLDIRARSLSLKVFTDGFTYSSQRVGSVSLIKSMSTFWNILSFYPCWVKCALCCLTHCRSVKTRNLLNWNFFSFSKLFGAAFNLPCDCSMLALYVVGFGHIYSFRTLILYL